MIQGKLIRIIYLFLDILESKEREGNSLNFYDNLHVKEGIKKNDPKEKNEDEHKQNP